MRETTYGAGQGYEEMWANLVGHEVGKGYRLPALQPCAHVLCYNFTLKSSPPADNDQPHRKDRWACSRKVSEVPLPVLHSPSFTASCHLVASSLNKRFSGGGFSTTPTARSADFRVGIRWQSPPCHCGAQGCGGQAHHLERCQAAGRARSLYLIHCFDVARFNHEGVSNISYANKLTL